MAARDRHRASRYPDVGGVRRFVTESEVQRTVELGYAADIGQAPFGLAQERAVPEALVSEERSRRFVSALERDAKFRASVMSAYDYRCAVSGFGIGTLPEGRATRLLDAAHIRPASERGSDNVSNGLAPTPTLHRLFDQGLFTIAQRESRLEVITSPLLGATMIESAGRTFRMPLITGLPVVLPSDTSSRPRAADLRYHATHVFKGAESLQ